MASEEECSDAQRSSLLAMPHSEAGGCHKRQNGICNNGVHCCSRLSPGFGILRLLFFASLLSASATWPSKLDDKSLLFPRQPLFPSLFTHGLLALRGGGRPSSAKGSGGGQRKAKGTDTKMADSAEAMRADDESPDTGDTV
jgi:hypothetical protein